MVAAVTVADKPILQQHASRKELVPIATLTACANVCRIAMARTVATMVAKAPVATATVVPDVVEAFAAGRAFLTVLDYSPPTPNVVAMDAAVVVASALPAICAVHRQTVIYAYPRGATQGLYRDVTDANAKSAYVPSTRIAANRSGMQYALGSVLVTATRATRTRMIDRFTYLLPCHDR